MDLRLFEIIVDTLEMLTLVIGVIVSILVLVRFSNRVGVWMGTVSQRLDAIKERLEKYTESTDDRLGDHGERLRGAETDISVLKSESTHENKEH